MTIRYILRPPFVLTLILLIGGIIIPMLCAGEIITIETAVIAVPHEPLK